MQRWTRIGWRWLTPVLALLLALTACSGGLPGGRPPDGARQTAEQLAAALSTGRLAYLPFAKHDAGQATLDYQQAMSGMSGLLPTVKVDEVAREGQTRFASGSPSATTSTAATSSSPATPCAQRRGRLAGGVGAMIVHPDLTPPRLYHERTTARRGSIVDATGAAIVENRAAYRVGIDKTRVEPSRSRRPHANWPNW